MTVKTGIREAVFDTETTGFMSGGADRMVEIAIVEVVDMMPTGRTYHAFMNPERDMPAEAFKVHGLSREFLSDKPKFREVADDILEFIGDAQLVAHNASFDMGFMNAELARMGRPPLTNRFVDTVSMAKRHFGGSAKVSLDDLCRRFGIDLSGREKHGAMIDTQLLARVYLELQGGRMRNLEFDRGATGGAGSAPALVIRPSRGLGHPTSADLLRHVAFLAKMPSNLWSQAAHAELT